VRKSNSEYFQDQEFLIIIRGPYDILFRTD